MLAYLPLIQRLLLAHISRRDDAGVFSFNFTGLGLMALSFILLFLALLFLLLALQTYLADLYGSPASWLATAALTLAIAGAALTGAHYSRRKKGLISRIRDEAEERLSPLAQIVDEIAAPVKDHPLAAVALAALAGLLAGDKLGDKGTE